MSNLAFWACIVGSIIFGLIVNASLIKDEQDDDYDYEEE